MKTSKPVSKAQIVIIRAGVFTLKCTAAALIGIAVGTAVNAIRNK